MIRFNGGCVIFSHSFSSNLEIVNITIRQQINLKMYNFILFVDFRGVIVRSVNYQYKRIFKKI